MGEGRKEAEGRDGDGRQMNKNRRESAKMHCWGRIKHKGY